MVTQNRFFLTKAIALFLFFFILYPSYSQLVISEISPNAQVESLEQYGGGEWFEICNIGQNDIDVSGFTVGHYEDASFGQSDFYLGANNDNCDCGGSYGVLKFAGSNGSGDVTLPSSECIVISGMDVDCADAFYCINARDLMINGPTGIVVEYNSSRTDFPGTGNGNGRGALEGHFWRQKNYECNAYFLWNANDEIIDAVNFNCLPQTGPDINADPMSGGFHYPNGNGGYYTYPPAFPTPPANGPFPVGIEITNDNFTWIGESIEEGLTFQRCSNDPTYVFPPMRFDENGNMIGNYHEPSCGLLNDNCCSNCDNNSFFTGIQLPECTNGSTTGLIIEESEDLAEQEVLTSTLPTCNGEEARLRSNYDENIITFCTALSTPSVFSKSYIGFVNSLDKTINTGDCIEFLKAEIYNSDDCNKIGTNDIINSNGRPIFSLDPNTNYTICFNYSISDCTYKNRTYWDNPCFSPFFCQMDVVCPPTIQDTVNCLADVPTGITDTMLFRTELGGEILGSCNEITISSQDSLGAVSGPKNERILFRTYTLTDGLIFTSCRVEYYIINMEDPFLALSTDTLFLDANGMLTIEPSMVIDTSYDFCGDPVDTSIVDPSMIDGSNLGELELMVTVIDSASNSTTLPIIVYISDNTPPVITCPNDTIINVEACICEAIVEFDDPFIFDENGDIVQLIRLDSTGLNSGDYFPAGTTTITYQAEDESGNISICSFDITIISGDPGPIVVRDTLHFSLSDNCDGFPTAAMFILDTPACEEESYELTIFDEQGNSIDEDSLRNYVNQLLDVEISYACFDNSASSNVLIEDKFAPQITCTSDTIDCNDLPMFDDPFVFDNCDQEPSLVLLNETLENVACTDPLLSRIIRRTYTSIDQNGLRSDTCFQTLSIRKFDLNTVTFDAVDTLIYCGNNTVLDEFGNPSPVVSGSPMAGGLSLYPDQNAFCGVTSNYDDVSVVGNSCGTTIVRVWTVFYWDCFQDGMRQFFQEINVVDTVGPAFTCPQDLTLNTAPFGCEAILDLPLPMANDLCNNGYSFNITYPDGFVSDITEITRTLGLGEHEIILEAVDDCGQVSTCSFMVTVLDDLNPIAIVTNGLTVALTSNEQTISANQLDNGSFDSCGPVELSIARMEDACGGIADDFQNEITVCCEDIGSPVMVQFLVTDQSGNTGFAMVAVNVEDNTAPLLVETLPDITLNCDFPFVSGNTTAFGTFTNPDERDTLLQDYPTAIFNGINLDGVITDMCDTLVIEESIVENYNASCGTGSITRNFIISDLAGNSITSSQNITFIDMSPLTTNDIDWPDDLTIINESCDPSDYEPNTLDTPFSFPTITDPGCSDVAFDNLDNVDFGPFDGDTLFIINRQWTGADWCQNINGIFVTFDSTQLITVLETREPTIVGGCTEIIECNTSPTCEDFIINSSINGMDICTPDSLLIFTYSVDFDIDGTIDATGNTNSLSLPFPIGEHIINWTLTDLQGDTDMCTQSVIIMSCQFPSPKCLEGEIFELEAVDTDNDGINDDEQVILKPEDIDAGSSSACGGLIMLSFSPDVNDTTRVYNCDSIGNRIVRLYVLDENGNQDFCETLISIEDNNSDDICAPPVPIALQIHGNITNELGNAVDDVTVWLEGANMATSTYDGHYQFPDMEGDQSYTLIPEYETFPLDGISTIDIIMIRKHILGLDPLDSPYKILAADVDNSGSINGLDLIALRKLILGKTLDFQEKNSWEFVPADTDFIDPQNPWLNILDEVVLHEAEGEQEINYFALKTGDMNYSSSAFNHSEIITRSSTKFNYEVISAGEELVIGVKLQSEKDISGFQFSFNFNRDLFAFTEVVDGNLKMGPSNTNDQYAHLGVVDVSWDISQANNTDDNYSFYLVFEQKEEQLENFFELSTFSEGLTPQVYFKNGGISSLTFQKVNEASSTATLYQNEPNPWESQTKIAFDLPVEQYIELKIYDISGKQYYQKNGVYQAGRNEIILDKSTFRNAGIYYYSLFTNSAQYTKKMILIE